MSIPPSTMHTALLQERRTNTSQEGDTTSEGIGAMLGSTSHTVASSEARVWRQPSPWWPVGLITLFTFSYGMRIGPRVQIITMLACEKLYENKLLAAKFVSVSLDFETCKVDADVQVAVTKVMSVMTFVTGLLGCFTVAWWGSISDRHGRARVIALTILGTLAQDINIVFTSSFHSRLPGGYWFLLITSIIEGLCGGAFEAAGSAAMIAYISDCTKPALRSRNISIFLGALYTGTSLGPSVGGVILRWTSRTALSVFYVAIALDCLFFLVASTLLPEPLPASNRLTAREAHENEVLAVPRVASPAGLNTVIKKVRSRAVLILAPLHILLPSSTSIDRQGRVSSTKDYRTTVVVTAYFFAFLTSGSLSVRIQYMLSAYKWSAEEVGYWLSISTGMRAICLLFIVPAAIRTFKSVPSSLQHGNLAINFDVALGRISLLIESTAYALMTVAPSGLFFTGAKAFGSLGSGFQPAIQSIVLELHQQRDYDTSKSETAGRLFGALSLVETLASQVIGPVLFGFIYARTASLLPGFILFAIGACFVVALVLLSYVQPVTPVTNDEGGREHDAC